MARYEPHVSVEQALIAFQRTERERRELLTSVASFASALQPIRERWLTRSFSRDIAETLTAATSSIRVQQDFVRALGAARISTVRSAVQPSVVEDLLRTAQSMNAIQVRLAETAAEQLRQISRIVNQYSEQLQPVVERLARLAELQQELEGRSVEFVERHGWPLPLALLALPQFAHIVGMTDSPKREVSRLMRESFRPGTRLSREAIRVLRDAPHFNSRRPQLNQGLAALRREDWYAAINTLLPLVEGVIVDCAWPPGTRPQRTTVGPALDAATQNIAGTAVITTIETLLIGVGAGSALFEGYDPNVYGAQGEPRSLNRHAILHGAARRYGTSENALKLFLLLVVMTDGLPTSST